MKKELFTTKNHIHLNIKRKWFDMVFLGVRKQHYINITSYWEARFDKLFPLELKDKMNYPIFETIVFSNGKRQLEIEWRGTYKGTGREDWGAEKGKQYFVFQLGNVIQSNIEKT